MPNSQSQQEFDEDYWMAMHMLSNLPGSAVSRARNLRIIELMREIYLATTNVGTATETDDQARPLRVIR